MEAPVLLSALKLDHSLPFWTEVPGLLPVFPGEPSWASHLLQESHVDVCPRGGNAPRHSLPYEWEETSTETQQGVTVGKNIQIVFHEGWGRPNLPQTSRAPGHRLVATSLASCLHKCADERHPCKLLSARCAEHRH